MTGYVYEHIFEMLYGPTRKGSVYFYSDTHFGDADCYMRRYHLKSKPTAEMVEQYDVKQVADINATVHKNDTLVLLGDVGDTKYVAKLKAWRKILIMGNHDKGRSNYERKMIVVQSDFSKVEDNHLFDIVIPDELKINDHIILSHAPLVPLRDYEFNIHGHDHANADALTSRYLNVCAEVINYKPIRLDDIIKSGRLSHIKDSTRITIDRAVERARNRKKRAK